MATLVGVELSPIALLVCPSGLVPIEGSGLIVISIKGAGVGVGTLPPHLYY